RQSLYFHLYFQCYRSHRDLHSFPTRRSSDLRRLLVGVKRLRIELPGEGEDAFLRNRPRAELDHVARLEILEVAHRFRRRPAPGTDRKSTRLNSSHVAISYAVFCLKKKKN